MYGRNLKAYNRTKLEAELLVASPHRVTQMLFEGLWVSSMVCKALLILPTIPS